MYSQIIKHFIEQELLPQSYLADAEKYFTPLVHSIINKTSDSKTPPIIGVSGAQGTGKTSLSELLENILKIEGFNVVRFSIDDFYLTKMDRQNLAKTYHPLLKTRGVPGTHDTHLLSIILNKLINQTSKSSIEVPLFSKALDDRFPENQWKVINLPVYLIILEGWFVGATPIPVKSLKHPINELEATEDKDSRWRRFMAKQLEEEYQNIFGQLNLLILLKAPSFEQVFNWRNLQEIKLRKREQNSAGVMSEEQLLRFIQHYERLTRHCLEVLPRKADVVYVLNNKHRIISCSGLD